MENAEAAASQAGEVSHRGFEALQAEFPQFRIWREPAGVRMRYVARGLWLGTRPYAVITRDLGELRETLAAHAGRGQCGNIDYPQAIAHDYPGWHVTCDDGQWTARCPAITVRAATAAALRAAIERAISSQ